MSKLIYEGADPMNKTELFKKMQHSSRSNMFAIEIPKASKEDESMIKDLAVELERDGKIKIRESVPREYSIYLHGIIKYSSE